MTIIVHSDDLLVTVTMVDDHAGECEANATITIVGDHIIGQCTHGHCDDGQCNAHTVQCDGDLCGWSIM